MKIRHGKTVINHTSYVNNGITDTNRTQKYVGESVVNERNKIKKRWFFVKSVCVWIISYFFSCFILSSQTPIHTAYRNITVKIIITDNIEDFRILT